MLDKKTLKELNYSDIIHLKLNGRNIKTDGATYIANKLPNTNIKYLDLSNNRIGKEDCTCQ